MVFTGAKLLEEGIYYGQFILDLGHRRLGGFRSLT